MSVKKKTANSAKYRKIKDKKVKELNSDLRKMKRDSRSLKTNFQDISSSINELEKHVNVVKSGFVSMTRLIVEEHKSNEFGYFVDKPTSSIDDIVIQVNTAFETSEHIAKEIQQLRNYFAFTKRNSEDIIRVMNLLSECIVPGVMNIQKSVSLFARVFNEFCNSHMGFFNKILEQNDTATEEKAHRVQETNLILTLNKQIVNSINVQVETPIDSETEMVIDSEEDSCVDMSNNTPRCVLDLSELNLLVDKKDKELVFVLDTSNDVSPYVETLEEQTNEYGSSFYTWNEETSTWTKTIVDIETVNKVTGSDEYIQLLGKKHSNSLQTN